MAAEAGGQQGGVAQLGRRRDVAPQALEAANPLRAGRQRTGRGKVHLARGLPGYRDLHDVRHAWLQPRTALGRPHLLSTRTPTQQKKKRKEEEEEERVE